MTFSTSAGGRRTTPVASGFTIIELSIVLGIVGVLIAAAVPIYKGHVERQKRRAAINDITVIQTAVTRFRTEFDSLPDGLEDVSAADRVDPWGTPYSYLNLQSGKPEVMGHARKDKSLVPINSDYDLYSKGKDGESAVTLTAKASHDDIVRANDGAFVGLAADY